jgi:hypothetical protein
VVSALPHDHVRRLLTRRNTASQTRRRLRARSAAEEDGTWTGLLALVHLEHGAQNAAMAGPIETAIRERITPESELPTPTGQASFGISEMTLGSLVLLFGPKKARTPISWACLEGIPDYLRGRHWVPIGANRDVQGGQDTLDGYLKGFIKRQTANYVAVVLERAGVVELDRGRPARVRLRS